MRHPLRSLLYIEWILFAVVMTLEVSPHATQFIEPNWLKIGIVATLAAIGLRLPLDRKLSIRVVYTIAQIILILIAAGVGVPLAVLLYIIVMIRSYLIFDRQYRLWLTAGIFGLYLMTINVFPIRRLPAHRADKFQNRTEIQTIQPRSPAKTRRERRDEFRWGFVVLFGGILFSLQLLIDRILAEKQAKEELAIANQRIRSYALKAEENGSLQERNRIAREIHDSLGHSLTALNLHLEMALKLSQIQPEKSREVLTEAKRLGSIALKDVRQSVSALRSDPLQQLDLCTAIYKLADEFKLSNYIQPVCDLDMPSNLPQPIATTIYRIIQEALTNISKHAQASQVTIEIQTLPTNLKLQIVDNGCGFIPTNNLTGFGLQGMRERVLSLQGEFEIISTPDTNSDLPHPSGCQIIAIIPLN
ncbi:sensor histidine kinase [Chamaesiphon sp. OTE_75_metabat_556]|uniref:sensor histidine kinase n=1 Tax=Chamaesiphon sp. OTE_75_metabat_556 TaxID=2964692 RepID=UPI00286C79DE|nr:sensor histidine kinase [Chamaesiphon sp. OTE_75_metabat_556]